MDKEATFTHLTRTLPCSGNHSLAATRKLHQWTAPPAPTGSGVRDVFVWACAKARQAIRWHAGAAPPLTPPSRRRHLSLNPGSAGAQPSSHRIGPRFTLVGSSWKMGDLRSNWRLGREDGGWLRWAVKKAEWGITRVIHCTTICTFLLGFRAHCSYPRGVAEWSWPR